MAKVCKKFDSIAEILPHKETVRIHRATLHPYKLIFQIKTHLQPVKSSDICQYGLSLITLDEVCSHNYDYQFLVGKCYLFIFHVVVYTVFTYNLVVI
jgi:hypothetical protein